eukprot:m51a1_g14088 hypothetical protein (142) ;mRNA; r:31356-36803
MMGDGETEENVDAILAETRAAAALAAGVVEESVATNLGSPKAVLLYDKATGRVYSSTHNIVTPLALAPGTKVFGGCHRLCFSCGEVKGISPDGSLVTHDASTLRGMLGSPVVALGDPEYVFRSAWHDIHEVSFQLPLPSNE